LRKWKKEVETQLGLMVKILKYDNGNNRKLKEFCLENVIIIMKIVPRTLEKNNVIKRINKISNERAKCMRIQSDLPKVF